MTYPLTTYHFQVEWGGSRVGFSEVTGLDSTLDVIEYREGSSPLYSPILMPGMRRFTNVVLKRGIMMSDNEFFTWINSVQLNQIERRDVSISLLNEAHEPAMRWKLSNAWPVSLHGPVLDAMKSEVAIERLELAYEQLQVDIS